MKYLAYSSLHVLENVHMNRESWSGGVCMCLCLCATQGREKEDTVSMQTYQGGHIKEDRLEETELLGAFFLSIGIDFQAVS